MKFKLLMISLLISSFCFAQSTVSLKSGETIEGNIVSLVNGVLKITFKGNTLNFNQSDLKSIEFVKSESKPQSGVNTVTGEVKGVVTYYFNKNYGDKPDVGAKIYMRKIDTAGHKNTAIQLYQRATTLKSLIDYKVDVEKYTKLLEELSGSTKEGYSKLNSDVLTDIFKVERDDSAKKVTADGNGNYSIKAEPGLYEVIFISKGRTSSTMAEISGKLSSKIVTIKSGEVKTLDYRFGL